MNGPRWKLVQVHFYTKAETDTFFTQTTSVKNFIQIARKSDETVKI